MGKGTNISWTDFTFNPWWGCQRVSPGCEHCYAETFAKRTGHAIWGPAKTTARRFFGERHWTEPYAWDAAAEKAGVRRRVFCASMADVFEDNPMVGPARDNLWRIIRGTLSLDWLLLTKRPENIASMLPEGYWPNVWLGTSTEDQQRADERIPVLLRSRDQVPVLFLSVEPQLGPVNLRRWLGLEPTVSGGYMPIAPAQLDWVISGGESGPAHRPFNIAWARLTRDQCRAAGVAWHFKQHGGLHHAAGGCLIDGEEVKEFPTPRPRELVLA
jgi:protein gp37